MDNEFEFIIYSDWW